ncbi:STAS domain-containing protein [Limibaculum sp. FT325]|uniref:STAS domain-containing protein n=1 Tax=Thermohalobaculum sediminis TaxID=2939436 RepID=UPI0020C0E71C|nr:STAS domain-containing protein [Limibaculum sediminis]MCL5776635.1 STAS domain-containing protein [Limibaculum sediminis]
MQISERRVGDRLVITLGEARLDHVIAADFRDHVLSRAAGEVTGLVLDLGSVQFMDSSGLGAVVGIRKRRGWGVRIVLAGLRSPVFRLFELARMTDVFTFYTSADAAVAMSGLGGYRAPRGQST